MIRNFLLNITLFSLFTLLTMPAVGQSYLPGVKDGSHNHDKNSNPSSKSNAEMQNNPAAPNLNNPAMVKPSDPTGVNSNTPGSSGTPPGSNAPGMNSGGQSPSAPPSGH